MYTADGTDALAAYEIEGHAMCGVPGGDIVCAGVSTLGMAALNTITDVCDLDDFVEYEYAEGYMKVVVDAARMDDRQRMQTQTVLKGMALNLESLARQYPDNVKLTYRRWQK